MNLYWLKCPGFLLLFIDMSTPAGYPRLVLDHDYRLSARRCPWNFKNVQRFFSLCQCHPWVHLKNVANLVQPFGHYTVKTRKLQNRKTTSRRK